MIRVGFPLTNFGANWLGGLNYFRSLLHAISSLPRPEIESVVLVRPGWRERALEAFKTSCAIVEVPAFKKGNIWQLIRRVSKGVLESDPILDRICVQNRIDVCSHGPGLGPNAKTRSIGWIPDFQHVYLPHLFGKEELTRRDRNFRRLGRQATRIVVSSNSAREDLASFMPESAVRTTVLRFVPRMDLGDIPALDDMQKAYGFTGKYIFLPGQFWVHKNHRTVAEALSLLKGKGLEVQVICTGATEDFRSPHHFSEIKTMLQSHGLEKQMRILGIVPYSHMSALMAHSLALINPSLFEGWSTTVEEAKLLGKRLILSNLPVHREQAGTGAVYFDALSAEECAVAIAQTWEESAGPFEVTDSCRMRLAGGARQFGASFQNIVLDALSSKNGTPRRLAATNR